MNRKYFRVLSIVMFTILLSLGIIGCGNNNGNSGRVAGNSLLPAPKKPVKELIDEDNSDVTLTGVLSFVDIRNKSTNFIDVESGVEYEVPYTGGTNFTTKYDTAISADSLTLGEIYDVSCNVDGVAVAINGNKKAFDTSGITSLEVNESKRKLTCGGLSYVYSVNVVAISGSDRMSISEVLKEDEVTLRGIDDVVYSVVVDRGHGYIKLTGIDSFVGGYAKVGSRQLFDITKGMLVTAETGTINVSLRMGDLEAVKEVTVYKDQETTLDFSAYVKEIKEQGAINFMVNPSGAIMSIDGEETDYSTPVSLAYGTHTVVLRLNNYEEYTETFRVDKHYETRVIDMKAKSGTATVAATTVNSTEGYMIKFNEPSGVAVYVDSVYIGMTPCSIKKTPGTKTVTLKQSGYNTASYSISVENVAGDVNYAFPAMVKTELSTGTIGATTAATSSTAVAATTAVR